MFFYGLVVACIWEMLCYWSSTYPTDRYMGKALKASVFPPVPLILFFCLIGAYTTANTVYDIYAMMIFGVLGYFMKKFD